MPRITYNGNDTDLEHDDWEQFDRTIRSDAPSWDEVDPDGDEEWTEWEDEDTDPDNS